MIGKKRISDFEGSLYVGSSLPVSFPICSVYAPLPPPRSLPPSLSSHIFPVENSISQNQHCCRSATAVVGGGAVPEVDLGVGTLPLLSFYVHECGCVCRVASDDVSCCKNSESSRDSPAVIAQLGIDAFRLRCAGSSSVTAVTNDTSYLRMD